MDQRKGFGLYFITMAVAVVAATFSAYALWQVSRFQEKWEDLDGSLGVIQQRTNAIETDLLNAEMTSFLNVASARLALTLNRQFVFYGLVDQSPLTHDVVVSLYTRDDFFKSEDPELAKFIINLVRQHTKTVLQTVNVTGRITRTRVDNIVINYLDNTDSHNLLAQYKNKKLRVKINNSFVPVSLPK